MTEKISKVSNPLTIIAIFAGLTEVMGTIAVSLNNSPQTSHLIYFLIGFPTLLVILFFVTLNFNSKVLYSPSDFTDESNYLKSLKVTDNYENLNLKLQTLETEISASLNEKSNAKIEELKSTLTDTIESIRQTNLENKKIILDGFITLELRAEIENKIFSYLNSKGQPQTLNEIAYDLKIEEDSVKKILTQMLDKNKIKMTIKNTKKAYQT